MVCAPFVTRPPLGEKKRILPLGAVGVDAALGQNSVEVNVGLAEIDVLEAVPLDPCSREACLDLILLEGSRDKSRQSSHPHSIASTRRCMWQRGSLSSIITLADAAFPGQARFSG